MMAEMAPACPTCRLVCTRKLGEEITITLLDYKHGFCYFDLSDTVKQSSDIQAYIAELLPHILAGDYEVELREVEAGAFLY